MNTTSKLLQSSPVADMSKVRNDRVWIVFMIYCFLVCLEKNSPSRDGPGEHEKHAFTASAVVGAEGSNLLEIQQ